MSILERFARTFIYSTEDEALARARILKEAGIYSTINHTIEDVDGRGVAVFAMVNLINLLSNIRDWELADFTSISVKMSALGMNTDKQRCETHLLRIIKFAEHFGVEVQFDVEAPETHQFYYDMVHKHSLNGAIQAKSPPILLPSKSPRIVKGAYKPYIRRSKTHLREQIFIWVKTYMRWIDETIIVGTHDQTIIDRLATSEDRYRVELQYLHGVKEKEFRKYREMGFKVREYIPYGYNWRPYIIRRIKEDPWGKFKLFLGSWRT